MSTIETNTVKPISGSSTLTLGESGDTVSLGSGVTAGTGLTGTTINNNADNRLITGSGTANTLEGEARLRYDGDVLWQEASGSTTEFRQTVDGAGTYWSSLIASASDVKLYTRTASPLLLGCNNAEKMRIDNSGNIMVGKTSLALGTAGTEIEVGGTGVFTASGNHLLNLNRLASDGDIVRIYQATSQEGSISVSGSTVSYNSFSGSHWSRLADNSKPTILRGTVMESISTLMDWYQVEYTKDEETLTEYIGALPDGKSVGDSHTVTVDGVEYTGTISKEDNERLPKCKISDTEDSKAVYGVFMDWDNDDTVNDMYVTALGAFVVRIHGDETVAIGDYLQSKGDGTAKVQADDILRASTIAKVTSTEKTHIYDDGSYCVSCTLHCG